MASQFFLKKSPDGPEVEIRASMKVGRLENNDLVLREARYASRHHATLTVEGERLYVEDAGSANGTFVNGHRIGVKTPLQNQDKVRFDIEEYVVRGPPVQMDAQSTIFRGAEQDKTVFRPPAAQPEPTLAPPEPAVAPAKVARPSVVPPNAPASAPAPVAAKGGGPAPRLPGAWSDPQLQNNDPNATKFIQRDAKKSDQTTLEPAGLQNSMQVEVPTLLILSGKLAGQRMEMRAGRGKNEWIIGSNAGLDVTLPDEGVSHVHASIEHEGGRWTLYNKLATNGLLVNGSLTTRRLLESHDRIEFGPVKTKFLLPKSFPLMQTARSPFDAIRRLGSSPIWLAAAAFVVTLGVIVLVMWILR